jgi:hypothetical protein
MFIRAGNIIINLDQVVSIDLHSTHSEYFHDYPHDKSKEFDCVRIATTASMGGEGYWQNIEYTFFGEDAEKLRIFFENGYATVQTLFVHGEGGKVIDDWRKVCETESPNRQSESLAADDIPF